MYRVIWNAKFNTSNNVLLHYSPLFNVSVHILDRRRNAKIETNHRSLSKERIKNSMGGCCCKVPKQKQVAVQINA